MLVNMYSVYDNKAMAYLQPFFFNTNGLAIRAFTTEVNTPSSMISRHPADYTLFHLGTFDDSNGTFFPSDPPANLGMATQYVEQQPSKAAPGLFATTRE